MPVDPEPRKLETLDLPRFQDPLLLNRLGFTPAPLLPLQALGPHPLEPAPTSLHRFSRSAPVNPSVASATSSSSTPSSGIVRECTSRIRRRA